MKRTFFLSTLFFVLAVQFSWAPIPQTISYQGVLTDTSGKAVPDGVYNLTFKLYDDVIGGTPLWSETQPVTVSKGIFHAILGAVNPLALAFDTQYWLGVTVEGGSELTPRIKLTASPYSLNPGGDSAWIASGDNIYRLTGNVGIGTTNPGAKLEIQDINPALRLRYTGNSGFAQMATNAKNDLLLTAPASNADIVLSTINGNVTIQYGGNVGIGTATPGAKLEIHGTETDFTGIRIRNNIYNSGAPTVGIEFQHWPHALVGRAGKILSVRLGGYNETAASHASALAFYTASNDFYQDWSRMAVSGNVGIGTTCPGYRLDVWGNVRISDSGVYSTTFTQSGGMLTMNSYGDWVTKTGGYISWETYDSGYQERMRITNAGNVGIGTANPGSYKLAVEGKIGAREVIVTLDNWSDFVFEKDYRLMPLSEVEQHIKQNKHLPNIPSEKEVLEKGVSLGEMQSKLLQKVEELTLYVIEQNKRIERLEKENEALKNRVAGLE